MKRPLPWEAAYPPGLSWDIAPPQGSLITLMERSAASFGAAPFLKYRETLISFAQFQAQVEDAAAGLLRLGAAPGEVFALYLPNSPYHPFSFFAVLKAGGVVAHLSPLDAERELIHKLADSGATTLITTNIAPLMMMAQKLLAGGHVQRLIVGDDAAFGAVPGLPLIPIPQSDPAVIDFNDLLDAPTPKAWPSLDPAGLAVLQYTGGTTGLPKAAVHTHETLGAAVEIYQQFYTGQIAPAEDQERVIAVLPFFHIYGLVVLLLWQLRRGAMLLLHLRFDPAAVLHDIEVGRATYFPGVPTMWIALGAVPGIETRDFSALRQVSSGGAPLPLEVALRFEALCGRRIGGGWGMTETAAAGTSHLMQGVFDPASVGVPLPGVDIRIVSLSDPAQEVPPGETGEIAIRGPNIFKRYHNRPEDTAKDFVDGYFLTGDIGRIGAHGLMHLVDRKKDMIISGGFNVYPTQIESAIYEFGAVEECIVIGVRDDYRGQVAKAFIKRRDGAPEFTLEELRGFLADKIGKHELPASLEFRDALPKTPVGKLSKKELVAEAGGRAP
jgi:long-chain acyl-CoA synthetase